jgi:hypothetical protein
MIPRVACGSGEFLRLPFESRAAGGAQFGGYVTSQRGTPCIVSGSWERQSFCSSLLVSINLPMRAIGTVFTSEVIIM